MNKPISGEYGIARDPLAYLDGKKTDDPFGHDLSVINHARRDAQSLALQTGQVEIQRPLPSFETESLATPTKLDLAYLALKASQESVLVAEVAPEVHLALETPIDAAPSMKRDRTTRIKYEDVYPEVR